MKYYIYANLSLPKSNNYEEGDPSIRLHFTDGEKRIGHAYISGFDSPNGFLYNFRIYERFQDQGYGSGKVGASLKGWSDRQANSSSEH